MKSQDNSHPPVLNTSGTDEDRARAADSGRCRRATSEGRDGRRSARPETAPGSASCSSMQGGRKFLAKTWDFIGFNGIFLEFIGIYDGFYGDFMGVLCLFNGFAWDFMGF